MVRAAASFFASADADFFLCFFFSERESSTSVMMGECECVSVIGFGGLLGFKMEVAKGKIYMCCKNEDFIGVRVLGFRDEGTGVTERECVNFYGIWLGLFLDWAFFFLD